MSARTAGPLRRSRRWVALMALLAAATGAGCGSRSPALASTNAPAIRVLLGKPRPRATLRIRGQSWDVVSSEGRAFSLHGTDVETTLQAGASGIAFRGRETGATQLRVRPVRSFTLDETVYAGTLVVRSQGGLLHFVNEVDLETYVAGVVANELAPGTPPATFRAQAVAARTYGWMKVSDPSAEAAAFHVYDSDRSQVYRGLTIPPEMTGQVTVDDTFARARETRGVILTWQGRPFRAWYSSTCGGHTTDAATGLLAPDAAMEPLRGVPCAFCGTSKYFRWEKQVGDEELAAGLKRDGRPVSMPIHSVELLESGRGEWARSVRVVHGPQREEKIVPGATFRSVAGLRSHRITRITRVPSGWMVEGGGWGHGVGMCQWGAIEMGRRGFAETDILRHYYPGVSFTKIY